MRILLIAHGFPPTAMGGTEIYTHDLGRTLVADHGDEVTVLTREADPERPEHSVRSTSVAGMTVYLINNTFDHCSSFADTYRGPQIRVLARRIISKVKPDVVHIQHLTCLSTEILTELHDCGIPTFFTLNDYWLICHRGQLLNMDLQRCDGPDQGCQTCIAADAGAGPAQYQAARFVRQAERILPGAAGRTFGRACRSLGRSLASDEHARNAGQERAAHMLEVAGQTSRILAPSNTLHQRFLEFGIPSELITRIEQGISQDHLTGIERTPSDHLRLGFLGSMIVSKAPHLLLEAFSNLPSGSATLEIYGGFGAYHGDDSYRHQVEPLLDQPGVNHHGVIPHHEVPRALANIDVLVIPSIWLENAPFVIREAFVAGIPVIASDLGGMADMVRHEVDGLHFRPGDSDALLTALERLINEPELLERLRSGIRSFMTIEQDAAQLRELYLAEIAAPATERQRVAAVVLNYRTPHETVLAVRSLQSSRRPADHIIVVDNGSGDDSLEVFERQLTGIDLVASDDNLGFSGGCNLGIRQALQAGADAVLLVNSDVMLTTETLGLLESALSSEVSEVSEVGIASPLILDRAFPGHIASAGMRFSPSTGRMRHLDVGCRYDPLAPEPNNPVSAASGCALLISKETFNRIGLLDEDYFFTFEDLDYGLRASQAGITTVTVGNAVAYHAGSLSIGPQSTLRLYYATRNHLLAAHRAAPLPVPLSWMRALVITALNVAHAARFPGPGLGEAIAAVLKGYSDHLRGRYGQR